MPTLSVDQLVGQTLGNYRVEQFVGQGRLNAVYLARSLTARQTGALTLYLIPPRFSPETHSRFITRFLKEAAAITTLQHPHILPIYEYGEHGGYPYLVTPYMMNGSLADIIKQQGACSHEYALEILEQVVAGVSFAHQQGFIHGTLKPTNIVLNADKTMQVAGFGLMHMLQVQGIERSEQPYAHLLSIAGTFLAGPEYIAPEVVQGQSIDARSDIYSLGAILFELLSGSPLFSGSDPIEIAKKHVKLVTPSLRALRPDIPIAIESVVNHALEREPARRFQYVDELLEAFSQVSLGATGHHSAVMQVGERLPMRSGLPNTDSWQLVPPIVTGHLPTLEKESSARIPAMQRQAPPKPVPPPPVRPRPVQPPEMPLSSTPAALPDEKERSNGSPKPFEWWSLSPQQEPLVLRDTGAANNNNWGASELVKPTDNWGGAAPLDTTPSRPAARRSRPLKRSRGVGRRQAMALLATGGVVALGAAVATHLDLVRMMANLANLHLDTNQLQKTTGNANPPANPPKQGGGHTGTVVGVTTMALDSAVYFVNPADQKMSVLIHLVNGGFTAYERACTHEGVSVRYDPGTRTLVCPAHGAVFDPANGNVLQGPATTPIRKVAIRVNGDGTITTA
ncbi:MAG TPA: protein kinase [Ktedonosporobacter sp.]|jgi:serine/threonine protein kinase/nitrite reductase/ring-hydroxylating ferredoxin subunit|nr:protein kinase [Ktedonosporobacter sp.]